MIIAIDGPAGAGKSTVARAVAAELGYLFLDTGAMYRAVTLEVLERGVDPADGEACGAVADTLPLALDGAGRVLVDGREREADLRSRTVTRNVSTVSAHPAVRAAIVARQRDLAAEAGRAGTGVVAEGRDTTTVVFPEAEHRFFLVASAAERARRRAAQEGTPERHEEILADIRRRDRLDETRAHSPLVRAPGAVVIDSDGLDAEQVTRRILEAVRGA